MNRKVLVVEDDDAIATALSLNLKLAGHDVTRVADGDAAIAAVAAADFALVLLDINLPKRNGLSVLEVVRGQDALVPVIIVSARDAEYDKVAALRLGADDYLTKPFALAELLARIDAVWRRVDAARAVGQRAPASHEWHAAGGGPVTLGAGHAGLNAGAGGRANSEGLAANAAGAVVRFGEVELHLARREVRRGGQLLHVTPLEFDVLAFLVRHPGEVLSRQFIFEKVWGQGAGAMRTVDNFIAQLRKLVELDPNAPQHIVTIRGVGYRFDFEGPR